MYLYIGTGQPLILCNVSNVICCYRRAAAAAYRELEERAERQRKLAALAAKLAYDKALMVRPPWAPFHCTEHSLLIFKFE